MVRRPVNAAPNATITADGILPVFVDGGLAPSWGEQQAELASFASLLTPDLALLPATGAAPAAAAPAASIIVPAVDAVVDSAALLPVRDVAPVSLPAEATITPVGRPESLPAQDVVTPAAPAITAAPPAAAATPGTPPTGIAESLPAFVVVTPATAPVPAESASVAVAPPLLQLSLATAERGFGGPAQAVIFPQSVQALLDAPATPTLDGAVAFGGDAATLLVGDMPLDWAPLAGIPIA
ncbi:hypothetical protein [Sphingomonas sp.]|uniref:hypothetical protein n=1 Tax=Sphingomonas sp. TaxID=28214 RepID=UPI001D5F60AF|nr:hypothetical protein [Sphingomonas sp.]MBX9797080.1 hypothetical protein [Sphingomonas sp.]